MLLATGSSTRYTFFLWWIFHNFLESRTLWLCTNFLSRELAQIYSFTYSFSPFHTLLLILCLPVHKSKVTYVSDVSPFPAETEHHFASLTWFCLCSITSRIFLVISSCCFLMMLSGIWNSLKVGVIHKEGVGQQFTSLMLMVALKDSGFSGMLQLFSKDTDLGTSMQKQARWICLSLDSNNCLWGPWT